MIKIDFTQPGKYPFTQNTLKAMQDHYLALANVYVGSHGNLSSGNYIINGALVTGANQVSAGFAVVDGELLNIQAGIGTHLELVVEITPVTYRDNTVKPSVVDRYLKPTNITNNNTLINDFERLSLVAQNKPEVVTLNQQGVGDFDATFQKIGNIVFVKIESGWEVGTGANLTGVPAKYTPTTQKFVPISFKPLGVVVYNEASIFSINTNGTFGVVSAADSEPFDSEFNFSYIL